MRFNSKVQLDVLLRKTIQLMIQFNPISIIRFNPQFESNVFLKYLNSVSSASTLQHQLAFIHFKPTTMRLNCENLSNMFDHKCISWLKTCSIRINKLKSHLLSGSTHLFASQGHKFYWLNSDWGFAQVLNSNSIQNRHFNSIFQFDSVHRRCNSNIQLTIRKMSWVIVNWLQIWF